MKKKATILKVRASDFAGDTIMATAILRSLRYARPQLMFQVWAKHTQFFELSQEVHPSNVFSTRTTPPPVCDLDLREDVYIGDYLTRVTDPQFASTPILAHMFASAESQTGIKMPKRFGPRVLLSHQETEWAYKKALELRKGGPLVWIEKKTSKPEKDWPEESWLELIARNPKITFLDLSVFKFRPALAMMSNCDAGISLDSYPVHGAQAVSAPKTMVILIGTPPIFTGYPGQTIIDGFNDTSNLRVEKVSSRLRRLLST
jgi:ADP-heptose:LPS heptosyltransferase